VTVVAYDLPVLFGLAVAFGVAMYVINDGFDLGIGILFLFAPGETDRDIMMDSIGPIWDGNETWLVFGGTMLIAAFPVAYATVLPALYLPLFVMLFGLIFRGVAFEYRFRSSRFRRLWDWAFCIGSMLAAFMQGLSLGAFIDGIPVRDGVFVGATFGFVRAFTLLTGLGLVAGYALLGATWLILKTEGTTQAFGRAAARPSLIVVFAFFVVVSIWTPLDHDDVAGRWFGPPIIYVLWLAPLLVALAAFGIWRTLNGIHDALPFLLSVGFFLLAYLCLCISLWPYAVPHSVMLWPAASSTRTLEFLGIGVVISLPVILAHLGYVHWVFRGKTRPGSGYG
jgi:cytochrome d ubiquinol oxidase subunit II